MKRIISNDELEQALANIDNQRMIRKVCSYYSRSLSLDALKACADVAVWRCLQSHRDDMGQKFTSSLYRFIHWECLRELSDNKISHVPLVGIDVIDNSQKEPIISIILKEYLSMLPQKVQQIVIARYIENRTLEDIGNRYHYSKQGIQNILNHSLAIMKKAANGV